MKKFMLLLCVFAMVFVIGCQPSGTSDKSNNNGQPAKTNDSQSKNDAGESEQITMRFSWWGGDSRHQATLDAIDRYTELHPNIKIEGEYGGFDGYYQKLLTQLASHTAPDIIQVDYQWVGDLVRQGKPFRNIYDLTDIIDLTNFTMDPIKGYLGTEDYLIGVPAGINGRGFFYNTEFFEKYGIKASDDWNWDKVIEVGTQVNQQDPDAHLLFFEKNGILYLVRDWIKQQSGKNMFSDEFEMNFTEQDLVDAFTYVQKLVESGTIPPLEEMVLYDSVFPDQIPNWLNGQWGMSVLSASNLPAILEASDFKIDTMRWMVLDNAVESAITVAPTQLFSVNDDSPYAEEAAKFINWFLNDEEALAITTDTRGIPSNTHAAQLLEEQNLVQAEVSSMLAQAIAEPGSADNAVTLDPQLSDITRQYIYEVGYGQITPEQAASRAIADYQRVLDGFKSK